MSVKKRVPGANLYLNLNPRESITFLFGEVKMKVTYCQREGNAVKLAFAAPKEIQIHRNGVLPQDE